METGVGVGLPLLPDSLRAVQCFAATPHRSLQKVQVEAVPGDQDIAKQLALAAAAVQAGLAHSDPLAL